MTKKSKQMDTILEEAKETVIRTSVRLEEMNKGIFLSDLTEKIPPKYRFSFEVFREQLMHETYDFEGLSLRLELYSTWKNYKKGNHEEAWKLCFKESFTEDEFWRYLKLGIGYVLNRILTLARDMPVLASKFLPFCTTYNCEFRKGGCLFSIGDIFTIIELLLNDSYLNVGFKKKVLNEYKNEIQEKLYDKCLEFLNHKKMLPPFLAASGFSDGDSYITTKVLCHLYKMNVYTDKEAMKYMLSECVNNPRSQFYMPNPGAESGKIIIDTSPVLKIKIAQLLIDLPISDWEEYSKFIEEQISLAIAILKHNDLNLLMGPVWWGRDRYSSVGWCSHSDVSTVITAMDFLLDVFNKRRKKEDIVKSLKDGIRYLLNTKNPNYTWPVTTIKNFRKWNPVITGNSWNAKESKQIDTTLEEAPEIFNISFSNTVEATNVLLKALNLLTSVEGEED